MTRRVQAIVTAMIALAAPAAANAANDPLRGDQWGLSLVESDAAHAVATGRGAVVAVIDTGVYRAHPDLQGGRVMAGYDFVDRDADPQDTVDGHGTHVLGIVGATEGNSEGVASVAPGARLLPVRVLGDDGSGTVEQVAEGIDYAVAQGADVINLSLGGDVPLVGSAPEYNAAIDRALDAGRVVVAASGNDGLPACGQPAARGRLLCVGAVDRRRQRSFFSNFGQSLGLVAPGGSGLPLQGEDILSTFNQSDPLYGGFYTEIAGTSQATPHVAGVAALLVEKGLRGQAVVDRILATARDAGPSGPDPEYGAGIVNARRALAGLDSGGPPGGGAGQPGGGTGSAGRVSLRSPQRIRRVLRRGVRVRCQASGAGRCRVIASRSGRRLASGSRPLEAGRSAVTVARLNRRGRSVLRRALRRRRALRLGVRITLPGVTAQRRTLRLHP